MVKLSKNETTCSICGKEFIILVKSQYKYKVKSKYQCCYSCYLEARKKVKDVRKNI